MSGSFICCSHLSHYLLHYPLPPPVEKLSSMKPVLAVKKFGTGCCKRWGFLFTVFSLSRKNSQWMILGFPRRPCETPPLPPNVCSRFLGLGILWMMKDRGLLRSLSQRSMQNHLSTCLEAFPLVASSNLKYLQPVSFKVLLVRTLGYTVLFYFKVLSLYFRLLLVL